MKSLYVAMGAFIAVILVFIILSGSMNKGSLNICAPMDSCRPGLYFQHKPKMALPWQLDAVSIGTNQGPGNDETGSNPESQEVSCSFIPHPAEALKKEAPKHQG